ncbi:MAG: hypothetical protein OEV40_25030 [Acidimicrobiia bacterium]|nr:hypothetical protein [Acidimicrobiia bacterium]
MTDQTDPATDMDEDDELEAMSSAGADVEYMFAQTSTGVTVGDDGRITLEGVSPLTLFFSDRPYRLTGHLPTDEFVANWGSGTDSFAATPPNALLSLFEGDTVNDVVVVLTDPQLSGHELSYGVQVTDGELAPSDGPTSLFIDMIGRPLTPMSVAGVRRRGRRRAGRRMRRGMR